MVSENLIHCLQRQQPHHLSDLSHLTQITYWRNRYHHGAPYQLWCASWWQIWITTYTMCYVSKLAASIGNYDVEKSVFVSQFVHAKVTQFLNHSDFICINFYINLLSNKHRISRNKNCKDLSHWCFTRRSTGWYWQLKFIIVYKIFDHVSHNRAI